MKRTLIILAAAAAVAVCQAQQPSNCLGLNLGGGLGTALYSPAHGDRATGLGFGAGVHYAHFFGTHFGLGFGVNYSRLAASVTYDFTETTQGLTHASNPGVTYDLNTTYDGWRERQAIGLLGIPVEFFWRAPLGRHALIAGLGAQVEWPLHGTYTADEGSYTTTGYFPSIGHTVGDLPQHGFSTTEADFESDIEGLRTSVSLLADLGMRFAMADHWGLYVGLYAAYGLTSLADGGSAPLLELSESSASEVVYNGTFASAEVDAVRPLRAGLKLGIDFGWSCRDAKATPSAKAEPAVVAYEESDRSDLSDGSDQSDQSDLSDQSEARQREAEQRAAAERAEREKAIAEQAAREQAEARRKAAERERLVLELEHLGITFEFGAAEPRIGSEADATLRALALAMQADPAMRVLITGHTDNIGSAEANLRLGQERAEAVRRRLVELGVPADRIAAASRGEEQPIDTNDTPEGRARNRRVEVAQR